MGRHFLLWCTGIVALSWIGCGSGAAAVSYLDPQTAEQVRQAHRMADDLHGYHHYEKDSSPYRTHCAAHDRYDELSVKFDMAVATGDVFAARIIGDALADLGEEISYDEYLEDKYDDGYDSCFCRFVDYILGDHSAFVDVQFGYSGYRWVVEDFDGTKWGGILGVGGGFAIPLTQRFYGFVRVGAYETSDSRIDLFSPDSDFSARMQWLVTGEAGLGVPIFDRVGVRASAGFALADLKVVGPDGISDGKTVPGYTLDGGIDIKLAPKWKLTLDTRYTQLQETNFSPLPAVNLAVSPKILDDDDRRALYLRKYCQKSAVVGRKMRRIAFVLTVFVGPALLLVPHALAQTSQPTPEQLKAANAKFTACHNKAVATKVGPKDRRAFMKSCLAGS